MRLKRLIRHLGIAVLMMLVAGPLTGLAMADRGGQPNDRGRGRPLEESADLSNPLAIQNADHSDETQCDGDSNEKSDTGNGANSGGPYDNTCPDGPSENGNGDGQQVGQPCAGCVGQADDKNPQGQYPFGGGSHYEGDQNNGYECDGNSGIARSNPAHTGCEPAITTTPPPPVLPEMRSSISTICDPEGEELGAISVSVSDEPSGADVDVLIDGANLGGEGTYPMAAGNHTVLVRVNGETLASQSVSIEECPAEVFVLGESFTKDPKPVKVLGVQMVAGQPLPRTGVESVTLVFIAAVFGLLGSMAISLGRRSAAQNF